MEAARPVVIGPSGLRGHVDPDKLPAVPDGGPGRTLITLEDGRRLAVPSDLLVRQADGTYRLALSEADIGCFAADEAGGVPQTVPVIEERIEVGKRVVETGRVQIRKTVEERTETVDRPLMREEADVRRVEVNRYVEQPPEVRSEGDTLIFPVVEEVLVVSKRLLLREEVRVTRRRTEEHRPQEVSVRKESVEVRRTGGGPAKAPDAGMGVAAQSRAPISPK